LTKFAILGSFGVGKSAFIVFLAFYMASFKSRSVHLLRRLKGVGAMVHRCVVLSQDYYYKVKFDDLYDFGVAFCSLYKKILGLFVLSGEIIGFSHTEVIQNSFLFGYGMLATLSQFRWKGDDPTEVVVLPT